MWAFSMESTERKYTDIILLLHMVRLQQGVIADAPHIAAPISLWREE
jgi:hypothetical protein